jgi:hypothetical protein
MYKPKTTQAGLNREDVLIFPPYLGDLVEDSKATHELVEQVKFLKRALSQASRFCVFGTIRTDENGIISSKDHAEIARDIPDFAQYLREQEEK